MKKIIVMLFLVLTVSIVISQKTTYANGTIRKGNLLIYNETPFSNETVLRSFRNYWSNHSKRHKQKVEQLYYWVVKTNFKVETHPQYKNVDNKYQIAKYITGCFKNIKASRFFKHNKYVIRRNSHGVYYVDINNYIIDLFTKKYSVAKEFLTDKLPYMSVVIYDDITHSNGNIARSCNHRFLRTKQGEDILLKPSLMKLGY